jgi:succinate dehydrogenase hydrophobic anchor subunit
MTIFPDRSIVRRLSAVISVLVLALIALMQLYSVLAIALDRQPLHRPWWETAGIMLTWTVLIGLLIGIGLLLTSRGAKMGFILATTNILVVYSIVLFENLPYGSADKAGLEIFGFYSAFLVAGIFAVFNLRNLSYQRIAVDPR